MMMVLATRPARSKKASSDKKKKRKFVMWLAIMWHIVVFFFVWHLTSMKLRLCSVVSCVLG